jgi:hypothetical protein
MLPADQESRTTMTTATTNATTVNTTISIKKLLFVWRNILPTGSAVCLSTKTHKNDNRQKQT